MAEGSPEEIARDLEWLQAEANKPVEVPKGMTQPEIDQLLEEVTDEEAAKQAAVREEKLKAAADRTRQDAASGSGLERIKQLAAQKKLAKQE